MLDYLGVEKIADLPIELQIKILALIKEIDWDCPSNSAICYFIGRLAEEAEAPHPRAVVWDEYWKVVIPEIGRALSGLYANYGRKRPNGEKMPDFMLDRVGVPKFDDLSWQEQLACLKKNKKRKLWDWLPHSTHVKTLALLQKRTPKRNGVRCPHLRGLVTPDFDLFIKELDSTPRGLMNYWKKKKPKSYQGRAIDYMLDQLGIAKFNELDYEIQCTIKRYNRELAWNSLPRETVQNIIMSATEQHDVHIPATIGYRTLEATVVPELGSRIGGLLRGGLDQTLIRHGLPSLARIPFDEQLEWSKKNRSIPIWGRLSDMVISHYLSNLALAVGKTPSAMDFRKNRLGRQASLSELYKHLLRQRPQPYGQQNTIAWAMDNYSHIVAIRAKRFSGARLLSQQESDLLIQAVQSGHREAANHLIYFYEPLITKCVAQVTSRIGCGRKTFDELMQVGRWQFYKLVMRYKPEESRLTTFVLNSLPWHIRSEINRDAGQVHKPAYFIELMQKIKRIREDFINRFRRLPTEQETASRLGITTEKLQAQLRQNFNELSLATPVGREGSSELKDYIPDQSTSSPEKATIANNQREILSKAIEGSGLNKMEKEVLRKRNFDDRTLKDIGTDYSLSRERIRQIEAKAKKKIAKGRFNHILRSLM